MKLEAPPVPFAIVWATEEADQDDAWWWTFTLNEAALVRLRVETTLGEARLQLGRANGAALRSIYVDASADAEWSYLTPGEYFVAAFANTPAQGLAIEVEGEPAGF